MAFTIYPRNLENLEKLMAEQMSISMDEMEVEERLRIYNRNIDTRYILDSTKNDLAAAVSRLYYNNHTWGNKPQSRVILTVPGKSAGFASCNRNGKAENRDSLGKLLRVIAKLEEYPYVDLSMSYGLQPSVLAPLFNEMNQDALLEVLPLLDYQCLFTLKQGHELHLCTLAAKDGAVQLVEVEPQSDLSLTASVPSWSSGNFIFGATYPLSTPKQTHERILAVMQYFAGKDGDNDANEGLQEEWKGSYNPNAHLNMNIKARQIEKDLALLQDLAKEIKSAGGEMSLTCHLRGDGSQFAVLVIEGNQEGVTAKTACLPVW